MNDAPAQLGGEKAKTTPYASEARYGDEELAQLKEALDQQTLFYAAGKKVKQLEAEFATKNGSVFAIATSSGTASVHAALIAAGVGPGDEVILSPITDMGTAAPILFQGAVPVFADLTPDGHVLDPKSVAARITDKTRAVLAVHLWGNACDLDALTALCEGRDIALIEDCAQAFGATYKGKPIGTVAPIGCFSYNEFKHISCGDGGLTLTSDPSLAERLRLATDKGYSRRPDALVRQPVFLCNNYRMTELQGAVAIAQLRKLDSIVARRRAFAERLQVGLTGVVGIRPPQPTDGANPSWWFYMLRVDEDILGIDADTFCAALSAEGIRASAHYIAKPLYHYPIFADHSAFPHPGHAYDSYDYSAQPCPEAEAILKTCVQLPVNEAFTKADADEIAFGIRRLCAWLIANKKNL
jgi:perosamine synthetase